MNKAFSLALILTFVPALANAQSIKPIVLNQEISANIQSGKDYYSFRADAGKIVTIHAFSSDIDTIIEVYKKSDPSQKYRNDDAGYDTNSQIAFKADDYKGDYIIEVSYIKKLKNRIAQNYKLKVYEQEIAQEPAPQTLALNQNISAQLLENGARDNKNTLYNKYIINLKQNQPIYISAKSANLLNNNINNQYLDPLLEISDGNNILAKDDDSGAKTNAFMIFTPPKDGQYIVKVGSHEIYGAGQYNLSVREAIIKDKKEDIPKIAAGQVVFGSFNANSQLTPRDTPFAYYSFEAIAGEQYKIDMKSTDFDSYLDVGEYINNISLTVADDDNGGGKDASVNYIVKNTGTQIIKAQGFRPEEYGSYTISISKMK